jgi:hypothetical protein
MAPRSQNPKAPARGAARDGSPSVHPQTNTQEGTPDIVLPEHLASSDNSNIAESITIAQLQEQIQSLRNDRP